MNEARENKNLHHKVSQQKVIEIIISSLAINAIFVTQMAKGLEICGMEIEEHFIQMKYEMAGEKRA